MCRDIELIKFLMSGIRQSTVKIRKQISIARLISKYLKDNSILIIINLMNRMANKLLDVCQNQAETKKQKNNKEFNKRSQKQSFLTLNLTITRQIKMLLTITIKKQRVVSLKARLFFQGNHQLKLQRTFLILFYKMIQSFSSKSIKSISNYSYQIEKQTIVYHAKAIIPKKYDIYDQLIQRISLRQIKILTSTFKPLISILEVLGICKTQNIKIINSKNRYLQKVRSIFKQAQQKKGQKESIIEILNQQQSNQKKVHNILQLADNSENLNQDQAKKGGYFLIAQRRVKMITQKDQKFKQAQYGLFAGKVFNPKQKHKKLMSGNEMKQLQIEKTQNELKMVQSVKNTKYLINYYRVTPETVIQNQQLSQGATNIPESEKLSMSVQGPQPMIDQKEQASKKLSARNQKVCVYMQYFELSLSDYIYYNDFISIEESISLCLQLVKAVITLHQSGVIHRDLKPSNVLVDMRNPNKIRLRIIDLGQSCLITDDIDKQKNKGSTIPYSPAQSQQNNVRGRLSPNIDKWSIGINIYEILNGKLPTTYSKAFLGDIQHTWPSQFMMPIDIAEKSGIKVINNVLNFVAIKMIQVKPEDRASLYTALLVLEQTKNYITSLHKLAF